MSITCEAEEPEAGQKSEGSTRERSHLSLRAQEPKVIQTVFTFYSQTVLVIDAGGLLN